MSTFLILFLFLLLDYGPRFFFEYMVYDFGKGRPALPLTGHEVARRLLDAAGVSGVQVVDEPAEAPAFDDHYDPLTGIVSLSPAVAAGRTAAAYAIAAHETGHVLQHASGDQRFDWLMRLKGVTRFIVWGFVAVMAVTLLAADTSPELVSAALIVAIGTLVLVRLLTVPTEWDASFGRGLPALEQAGLLPASERETIWWIMFAAATTYIGAALIAAIAAAMILFG